MKNRDIAIILSSNPMELMSFAHGPFKLSELGFNLNFFNYKITNPLIKLV